VRNISTEATANEKVNQDSCDGAMPSTSRSSDHKSKSTAGMKALVYREGDGGD
jgi:hypothetical protein